ncbi:hypothetical protein BS47DRAFT_1302998 [Hydnum rufescens UP504]|uniref:Ribosomal RNA-processing protein 40 n=1 Tax=Hydnum rufescens UP504 TaxID=1448309 RepID=A0A9P6DMV8_9AGAM|nr:hypothetical protein BS47DRAFT_1302998 [Hydnum rufescens UP504]
MSVVLPGDIVLARPNAHSALKLGPGLLQISSPLSLSSGDDPIIATRPGLLKNIGGKQWWVERNLVRYTPSTGESVVGIITAKHSNGFRVDIGSAHQASLDELAFESATKRNRVNLKIGALIYARVCLAHRDMEPEIECVDPTTHKSDGFGELKSGFMVTCSLGLARSLLSNSHPLLRFIGARFPFEVAIGTNGRVWFKASEVKQTACLARAIEWADGEGEGLSEGAVRKWIEANIDV